MAELLVKEAKDNERLRILAILKECKSLEEAIAKIEARGEK